MKRDSSIFIAGHKGMVGSAIVRILENKGYTRIITVPKEELDLINQDEVNHFFEKYKPEYVFLTAAKVGGILANSNYKADFIYENLMIQSNCIHSAYKNDTKKLLFLGSSCIYPKMASQPIKETSLLTGPLESTNDAYALAKIAGIKMCQSYNKQYNTNFICAMPCNLYGQNDSFDLQNSHVLSALIRKFHEAKENRKPPVLWGTGEVYREFLHVDDLADACVFLMKNYDKELINIGSGKDITIKQLANLIKKTVGYDGDVVWDKTKPNGTPKKLLDIHKINSLGWKSKIGLEKGITSFYQWYLENHNAFE